MAASSSSSSSSSSRLRLKLVMDSKTNRVIFGEANKEFVDFLVGILGCPVGLLFDLLLNGFKETVELGSIGSLFKSFKKLPTDYMHPHKTILNIKPNLSPSDIPAILARVGSISARGAKTYAFSTDHRVTISNVSAVSLYYTYDKGEPCHRCSRKMETEVRYRRIPYSNNSSKENSKNYVCNVDHVVMGGTSGLLSPMDVYYTQVKGTACPYCKRKMDPEEEEEEKEDPEEGDLEEDPKEAHMGEQQGDTEELEEDPEENFEGEAEGELEEEEEAANIEENAEEEQELMESSESEDEEPWEIPSDEDAILDEDDDDDEGNEDEPMAIERVPNE